jgi:hypothetical protein
MTKQELYAIWTLLPELKADLEAVIATEIEKAKVQPQPSDKVQISKHTLVEVNRAFRALKQDRNSYIHKVFSDDGVFDAMEEIRQVYEAYFGGEERQIKPKDAQPQPTLNPILEAYEQGDRIRHRNWGINKWIKKHSDILSATTDSWFDKKSFWDFDTNPKEWEIWHEDVEPEQVTEPAKPKFDQERFEAMFRAVVQSGTNTDIDYNILVTKNTLKQLDAYYATKKGGEND